jgi:integrase
MANKRNVKNMASTVTKMPIRRERSSVNLVVVKSEFRFKGILSKTSQTGSPSPIRLDVMSKIKKKNPRLLQISFHTFRDWKATMLYHKTKDPYYVKQFLGHKCLSNTEIYINIERSLFEEQGTDEFTVRVAEESEDIKALLEVGFEYVCQKDGLIYVRKRK